jgi:hypothetical protein
VPTPDDQVRPFAAVLGELHGGRVHARLTEQLAALTAAVTATGKKGTLTIQLEVKPLKAGQNNVLQVIAKSVAKVPEGDDAAPTTVFYATEDGVLTRDDPQQPQLPLRGLPNRQEHTA